MSALDIVSINLQLRLGVHRGVIGKQQVLVGLLGRKAIDALPQERYYCSSIEIARQIENNTGILFHALVTSTDVKSDQTSSWDDIASELYEASLKGYVQKISHLPSKRLKLICTDTKPLLPISSGSMARTWGMLSSLSMTQW